MIRFFISLRWSIFSSFKVSSCYLRRNGFFVDTIFHVHLAWKNEEKFYNGYEELFNKKLSRVLQLSGSVTEAGSISSHNVIYLNSPRRYKCLPPRCQKSVSVKHHPNTSWINLTQHSLRNNHISTTASLSRNIQFPGRNKIRHNFRHRYPKNVDKSAFIVMEIRHCYVNEFTVRGVEIGNGGAAAGGQVHEHEECILGL